MKKFAQLISLLPCHQLEDFNRSDLAIGGKHRVL